MKVNRHLGVIPSVIGIILLFILLLALGMTTALLLHDQNQLNTAQETRYNAYLLASELRRSSDDLTRAARNYVITGNPLYEQEYWDILAVRNGQKPRADGTTIPLQTLIFRLGFTPAELAKLKQAEDNSNSLVKTEMRAFNAMKGLFQDERGKYTKLGKPDPKLAIRVMYDEQYNRDKNSIMQPIDDFMQIVHSRTQPRVASIARRNQILLWTIAGLIGFGFLVGLIQIRHLYTKVLKPLGGDPRYAADITNRIASGDLGVEIESYGDSASLLANLKNMQASLKDMVAQMTLSARQVSSAAAALTASRIPSVFSHKASKRLPVKEHANTSVDDHASRNAPHMLASVQAFKEMAESIETLLSSVQESEAKTRLLATIVQQSHEAIFTTDLNGDITSWNGGAEQLFEFTAEEVVGQPVTFIDILEEKKHGNAANLTRERSITYEKQKFSKNGMLLSLEISIAPLLDESGKNTGEIIVARDISERKYAQAILFEEKERAQVTLASIGDGVITTDTKGCIQFLNPVAERVTGWTLAEAQGKPLLSIYHVINEATLERAEDPVIQVLREKRNVDIRNDTVLVSRDGEHCAIEDSAAPIRDRDGSIIGVVLVFRDVSQARKLAHALSWQASHDALTDLFNRRDFERRLEQLVEDAKIYDHQHALLYLDLDQFKIVNDTCGHVAGDELLRQVVSILLPNIRDSDILARIGGDEFGVLLESCPAEQSQKIAEALRRALSEFRFVWQDRTFVTGVSIGMVQIDRNTPNIAAVLSAADAACYSAKDKGRNRVQVYHPDDNELAQRRGEMQWVSRINQAFEENRLCLYFQTICPAGDSREAEHFELMLRLVDEEGNLVPPMAFIPAAERYNLMPSIDRRVISLAFQAYADRHNGQSNLTHINMINLSGASLSDDLFLDFVHTQFETYGVPPQCICFEITETAAIANFLGAIKVIRVLKELGCRFALDDFGSGLSSFTYLKNLPVDYLKIDGSFVKDMETDPIDRAMVQAINNIGHVMGIRTVAEFVENEAIKNIVKDIGVDYMQGYAIAKPRPIFEM